MFTSDNRIKAANFASTDKSHIESDRDSIDNSLNTAFRYLIISIAVALFGAVYEYFSFGVWSAFMVYAFMVPLLGGALPFMLSYIRRIRRKTAEYEDAPEGTFATSAQYRLSQEMLYRSSPENETATSGRISGRLLYHMALATLTAGSILKGVLDIYGTTNRLMIAYPATGITLIAVAAVLMIRDKRSGRTSGDTLVYTAEPENTIG